MKKLLAVVMLFIGVLLHAQNVATPNLSLQIPAQGSNNWNVPLNYNFNQIDSFLGGTRAVPNFQVTGTLQAKIAAFSQSLSVPTATITNANLTNINSPYFSATGTNLITFPGLAAVSGFACMHVDTLGNVSITSGDCGSGGGGGSMTWPATPGIAVYSGSNAWGTSLTAPLSGLVGLTDTQSLTNKTVNGVSPSIFSFLPNITSDVQTQLNNKQANLGFTPYNATNPAGYITPTALSPYALLSGANFTGPIQTPSLQASNVAATSGVTCLEADTSGNLLPTGAPCQAANSAQVNELDTLSASAAAYAVRPQGGTGNQGSKKMLTNCATGYSGGALQPTSYPVGQYYCSQAIQTTAEAAGGPTQGYVAVTAQTGTTSSGASLYPLNGNGAGDSHAPASIITNYGVTTYDAVCTNDPIHNNSTGVSGLNAPPCGTNVTAFLSETTDGTYADGSVLWPTNWNTNQAAASDHWYRDFYFMIPDVTKSKRYEFDDNESDAAGNYYGPGMSWNKATNQMMFLPQANHFIGHGTGSPGCSESWCPLNLILKSGSTAMPGCSGSGTNSCTLQSGHWYHFRRFEHRNGTYVTGGVTYYAYYYDELDTADCGTNVNMSGCPSDFSRYTLGDPNNSNALPAGYSVPYGWPQAFDTQWQLYPTAVNSTTSINIVNDVFVPYQLSNPSLSGYMPLTGGSFTGPVIGTLWNNANMYESASGNNSNFAGNLPTAATGTSDTAMGSGTLNSVTTGSNDTASGVGALYYLTTGNNDTAFGLNALQFLTTASGDTAVGVGALGKTTTGGSNVGIGNNALTQNTTGANNVGIGNNAGVNSGTPLQTGAANTYIGVGANANNDGYTNDVVIGYNAQATQSNEVVIGNSGTTLNLFYGDVQAPTFNGAKLDFYGTGNVVAAGSLPLAVSGINNTSVGIGSLASDTSGYSNTAIGLNALTADTSGYENNAEGVGALAALTTGNDNVAMGKSSLTQVTTGAGNVGIGAYSGYNSGTPMQTTTDSVFIGLNANASADGLTNDIVLGYNAQATQSNEVVIGNTGITVTLLHGDTQSATFNAAPIKRFGTGVNNIGGSIPSATTGTNDTAVGSGALAAVTSGSNNTAIGLNAGTAITTGGSENAFGVGALGAQTSGSANVGIGNNALNQNTTGTQNVAVGYGAGSNSTTPNTTGGQSTFIGVNANNSADALTNTTVIGYNAQATQSNEVMIGNSAVSQVCFAGGRMCWYSASGVPSTSLCTSSNIGSLYSNTNGGATTTLYVCTAAATWTAK